METPIKYVSAEICSLFFLVAGFPKHKCAMRARNGNVNHCIKGARDLSSLQVGYKIHKFKRLLTFTCENWRHSCLLCIRKDICCRARRKLPKQGDRKSSVILLLSLHKFWQERDWKYDTERVHALSSAISTYPMENVPATFFYARGRTADFFLAASALLIL
jgi:hypothetical protein